MSYRHRESSVVESKTVTTYRRFNSVQFNNPRGGSPSVKFDIETRTEVDGVDQGATLETEIFPVDPSITYDLLDSNGNVTGQITGSQLWRAIKSLFYHLDQ